MVAAAATKPTSAAAAASLKRGKGIFPRAGHSECVWVTHPLDAAIQVSEHIVQIGYATATW